MKRREEEVTKPVVTLIKDAYQSPKGYKRYVDFYIYSPEAGKGTGKTVFALRILKKIYGDWDKALDYLFVDPISTIEFLVDLVKKRKRVPCFACDDIGVWLSGIAYVTSKGRERRAIASFYEFYNAIRSVSASCLFTAPTDDLLRSIFKQVNFRIAIKPIDEDSCLAKIYKVKISPLFQHYVKSNHEEVFPVKIPDHIYQKYEDKRWNALEWKAKELLRLWSDVEEDVIEPNDNIIKEVVYVRKESGELEKFDLRPVKRVNLSSTNTYAEKMSFPRPLAKKYGLIKGDIFLWFDFGFPLGVPDKYYEKFIHTFFKKKGEDGNAEMDSSN